MECCLETVDILTFTNEMETYFYGYHNNDISNSSEIMAFIS